LFECHRINTQFFGENGWCSVVEDCRQNEDFRINTSNLALELTFEVMTKQSEKKQHMNHSTNNNERECLSGFK
jgi:hypothetical protein